MDDEIRAGQKQDVAPVLVMQWLREHYFPVASGQLQLVVRVRLVIRSINNRRATALDAIAERERRVVQV